MVASVVVRAALAIGVRLCDHDLAVGADDMPRRQRQSLEGVAVVSGQFKAKWTIYGLAQALSQAADDAGPVGQCVITAMVEAQVLVANDVAVLGDHLWRDRDQDRVGGFQSGAMLLGRLQRNRAMLKATWSATGLICSDMGMLLIGLACSGWAGRRGENILARPESVA